MTYTIVQVRAELGEKRCPFCLKPMPRSSMLPGRPPDPHCATRAHVHAVTHPLRRNHHWVRACQTCNLDQGGLALDEWLLLLSRRGDHRVQGVRRAVGLLRRAGVLPGPGPLFVVDVFGGPGVPLTCQRARHVRPLDEAVEFARSEVAAGFVVYLRPLLPEMEERGEVDLRVQGSA